MNIHYLQHVPFEGLGSMAAFFQSQGHPVTATHLYRGEACPPLAQFDWLVVMGGPMGVHDENAHPWLTEEKRFIQSAISQGKRVLGICLGAQLIANVMGARVYRNRYREIGWYPIQPSPQIADTIIGSVFPAPIDVFHWHGDTFDIPAEALPIASSEACQNQGFLYDERVIALQFHLETTPESAQALVKNCGDELDGSQYVQTSEQILAGPESFAALNRVMRHLLETLSENS